MSKDTLIVKSLLIRDLEAMLKREKEKLAHIKKQKYSESRILHEYFHDGIIAGIEKTIEAIKGAL